jgi:hypothetical protein
VDVPLLPEKSNAHTENFSNKLNFFEKCIPVLDGGIWEN